MTTQDLEKMSARELLDLHDDFVKMNHYEAVNEFDSLRRISVHSEDVRHEVVRRLKLSDMFAAREA